MLANETRTKVNHLEVTRRKRVRRMKMMILTGVVILLFTSVIINFVLIFKVLHFEKKIHKLYSNENTVIVQEQTHIQ